MYSLTLVEMAGNRCQVANSLLFLFLVGICSCSA